MMVFFLGQFADRVEEFQAGKKILHGPIATNAQSVVREPPAGELLDLPGGLGSGVLRNAPLAGGTFFGDQLFGGMSRHDILPMAKTNGESGSNYRDTRHQGK